MTTHYLAVHLHLCLHEDWDEVPPKAPVPPNTFLEACSALGLPPSPLKKPPPPPPPNGPVPEALLEVVLVPPKTDLMEQRIGNY